MKLCAVFAAALIAVGAASAPASAQRPASKARNADLVPVTTLAGWTGDELLGEWFEQVFELSGNIPSFRGRCLTLDPAGKVASFIMFAGGPPLTCTVKPGTALFVPTGLTACTDVDDPPFYGATEEEQRACAERIFSSTETPFAALRVSLDGGPMLDVFDTPFRLVTSQQALTVPASSLFGLPAGQATLVGAGHGFTTRGRLRPGSHTSFIEIVFADGTVLPAISFTLNVVPGHGD